MIAVKAIYDRGQLQFLEPLPGIEHALVAVIVLETDLSETVLAAYRELLHTMEWRKPVDEEGATALVAVHEELAPYRFEAEQRLKDRENASV
jgi:hypothetical protein